MSLTGPRYVIEVISSPKCQEQFTINYIWRLTSVSNLRPRPRLRALSMTPHGVTHNLETPQEASRCYRLTTAPVRKLGPCSKQERSLALGSGVQFIERISRGDRRRKCITASDQARWLYERVRTKDQGTKDFLYTPFFVANIAVIWTDLLILSRLLFPNFHHLPFPQWLPP